ncbi:xylan alpha-(1-_2)-glucuronosidase [Actinoplanes philippinensis]|uniref:Alpha-glucuronidase n=1 Tax=Actinoplanes philippinensis TaxID=35752 RepID=A0A1I2KWY5_9ACTN|nr:alpha-glucuronidase [Actinoplanes philippinensis]GIE80790.1 xylan alpha-(1->2)-glucuronosidase [Actinoplanes philippinensis]SFF71582.1 alpha-glucuronidase [Actinoplanes philippinensis]
MNERPAPDADPVHAAWLPPSVFRALGSRRVRVDGEGPLADTVRAEVAAACARFGGVAQPTSAPDLLLTVAAGAAGSEGFLLGRRDGATVVLADGPAGLLPGLFEVVRRGEAAFDPALADERHQPAFRLRVLDHWDNVFVHPVMGQVERGYAGGSIFWQGGRLRADLSRVRDYARLLAASGINAITVNNVNVGEGETHLLTDRLGDVAAIASAVRPYGIRVHVSVNFAAPVILGDLPTADPLDPAVRRWWASTTDRVFATIPDFGGYLVKADSEGQPGPFTYGRTHADGANMLAAALAPHGAPVRWRAFVYNHRQDWRDRTTDRARAAHDHFAALDGRFADNVILQVKHGPIDFQTREPVSPVLLAMPHTHLAVELQVTQEYTGQQRHICYLPPMWSGVLGFRPTGDTSPTLATRLTAGPSGADSGSVSGRTPAGVLSAVANVGDDRFWTGHPLAQANLYAVGRLGWAPGRDPAAILDEWISLTFPEAPPRLRHTLHTLMDDSWLTYEQYTAPLGVGFMVRPGHHYGPDVDGYEYTPWGTYHFADRDGIGVDRTVATGTGFTGQYPPPWSERYESLSTCPDELLLFFHHVPYTHLLHSGTTVIQHIYDTHFAGAQRVAEMRPEWDSVAGLVDPATHARVAERLAEQHRSAEEWRDQINTYFHRKSGVPDDKGRRIH